MISSIPKYLRSFGNSNAQLVSNLLGYFPSPFLYGLLCNLTGGEESRAGMILLMFWSVWGVLGLIIAKKFYANQLKKTAADNTNTIELGDLNKVCLKSSFIQFRDKNTSNIFNYYLERKTIVSQNPVSEEKTENIFSNYNEKITNKINEKKSIVFKNKSIRISDAKDNHFQNKYHSILDKDIIQSQKFNDFSKQNLIKVNSNPISFEDDLFNKNKESIHANLLRPSRVSRRKTSIIGNLSVIFGKNNYFIENDEDEDEEEDEEDEAENLKN